ncbi:TCR/Tet family MFS transporter [Aliirhizobium cellulosilyticum]|jgi:DHA1 family tetracycline resistance protein-like MFS transporter|uniref:DHA1 family tetracycline resistance protein-like MFS transporter n=1 Tax=Aliirhizobium cellulosilyticum TaxID=393664 RepID=A0A7W6S4Z9_9HYPH|nr:TCR/Tet family MFS transporter [Rhizobium cellulosilyticum]MBB4347257.1 DHA1 family tetracycline resistance protein-like MFS transporter [Rhizobium cellulosilyticum]MBB4410349.1 DHA1 family tetracycline resistance protein-like MFS transporter [Rhizobium cellulosilyticum]MBB4445036.1 DHA1 family tetracycline resistance protein-like MFS transporter [Rhizobium cellulosilyticum]
MLEPKSVRRGLFLVFVILFLDVIGIAIIMPVLPAFLQELTGDDVSAAAIDGGWLLLIYSAMQFLFAPLIGNLSDRFGRRPILLISVLTFAIDNLICAAATSFWMLFIGRALAGFSGGSFATCSAYIADISNDRTRARNFGLIGIAFGVGFTIGPVIGGLLGEFGPRVPFLGAGLLSLANFIAAWFLLPETLERHNRRAFDWRRANPLGALRQMRHYSGVGWILLVMFLYWLSHAVYPSVWSFVSTYRYGWSEAQIGLSLGLFGICAALVMVFVLPRLIPVLGEWRTSVLGICFSCLGLAGYAFSWEGWMVYAVILLTTIENVADPALRSIASAKVPPSAQGELQGAMTSMTSLTTIIGPAIFTQLFSRFTGEGAIVEFAGAPYLMAAIFMACAAIVFVARISRDTSAARAIHQVS